eukprot:Gb_12564 [translate_table: standard]
MDFRAQEILLPVEEFLSEEGQINQLPVNKVEGPYQNAHEYLDTHFRLLREDLLGPYRQGVQEFRKTVQFVDSKQCHDLHLYSHVRLVAMRAGKTGIEYVLKFTVEGHSKKVDWDDSKLLMFNSLLCISSDAFQSFFWAVVSTRRAKDLNDGTVIGVRSINGIKLNIKYETEYNMFESTSAFFEAYQHVLKVLQKPEMEKLCFLRHLVDCEPIVKEPDYLTLGSNENSVSDCPQNEELAIAEPKSFKNDCQWGQEPGLVELENSDDPWAEEPAVAELKNNNCPWGQKLTITELENLDCQWGQEPAAAELENSESDCQWRQEIAGAELGNSDCQWPQQLALAELENNESDCKWGQKPPVAELANNEIGHKRDQEPAVAELENRKSCFQSEQSSSPNPDIDYSQRVAIKHGLTRKLAIIQGPAGTGKTFVGLFITKQLLANAKIFSPIVVVCYTNRALDQFLEGIYKYETCLVRLGTGSKSHNLKKCSLEKFKKNPRIRVPKYLRKEAARLRFIQEDMAYKMNNCADCMFAKHVIRDALSRVAKEEHVDSLYFCNYCQADDIYESWLVGNQRIHPTSTCPLSVVDTTTISTIQNSSSELQEFRNDDDPSSIALFIKFSNADDVWIMDVHTRQQLHQYWLQQIRWRGQQEFWNLAPEYADICNQLTEIRTKIQLDVLSNAKILGMTTTVAARYYDILLSIKPQVMIVEEAAEVLEGQLLACLNPYVEHLILIGDHKQLRPSIATSRLAFNNHLDVSMFERLVRNGIEYKRLEVQRRMRPAISFLLLSFYPTLVDHRCVRTLDNVKGVRHNVFFLDHENMEETVNASGSKLNRGEADLVVTFCMFLMNHCGYSSRDITILSMYRSQANEINRLFNQYFYDKKRARVKDYSGDAVPKVRSVDEFQGEESNIIILSLVRNRACIDNWSSLESIGFLGIPNRICVALSRARMGLYIFGNATLLSEKSNIWEDIIERLSMNGWIGSRMRLYCPNHPEIEFRVRTSEDFRNIFCPQKCKVTLKCNHPCPLNCHAGGHDNIHCRKNCRRKLEWCGHLCRKTCHGERLEDCYPCVQCSHLSQ